MVIFNIHNIIQTLYGIIFTAYFLLSYEYSYIINRRHVMLTYFQEVIVHITKKNYTFSGSILLKTFPNNLSGHHRFRT